MIQNPDVHRGWLSILLTVTVRCSVTGQLAVRVNRKYGMTEKKVI